MIHSGSNSPQATQFSGRPATPFVGTYDIDSVTKKFAHPTMDLQAPMGPGSGWLIVAEQADSQRFTVASWVNLSTGSAGATGSAGTGDTSSYSGSASGGGAGVAGESGSGGTTAITENGSDGGVADAVAAAGTGAGGAAHSAGSGGSN